MAWSDAGRGGRSPYGQLGRPGFSANADAAGDEASSSFLPSSISSGVPIECHRRRGGHHHVRGARWIDERWYASRTNDGRSQGSGCCQPPAGVSTSSIFQGSPAAAGFATDDRGRKSCTTPSSVSGLARLAGLPYSSLVTPATSPSALNRPTQSSPNRYSYFVLKMSASGAPSPAMS